jgi:hypothetical protein
MHWRRPHFWLLAAALVAVSVLLLVPEVRQNPEYHHFADRRTIWGIPNFWNVISNAAFLPVGLVGLSYARSWSVRVLFAGVGLTAFGSAYYHWAPNDQTLFWDRLPMTLVFMAVTAHVIGLWTDARTESRFLWPLLAFGVGSAIWWRATGDLRPYALAQFGPVLVLIPAAFLVPHVKGLASAALLYASAKIAEAADGWMYAHTPLSGHTWKHLLAAGATLAIYRWVRR